MKRIIKLLLFTVFIGAVISGCTKKEMNSTSLKSAIDQSTMDLNNAVTSISGSKVFPILTSAGMSTKSATIEESQYKVYINLDTVKGVYNYKPVPNTGRWGISLLKYFTKTANSSKMIVNMPLKKVKDPRNLRDYAPGDSSLTNNFSIAVSDYHNNYNNYHDFDYILKSAVSIDNAETGNLNINYIISPANGIDYASQYAFTGGYTADYKYQSGDTTVSSFAISESGKVLYNEELLTIKTDTGRFGREHQYILTIGNVQIIRKSGTKTITVAVDGVVQADAVVTIVDKAADSEASVCKKRDIQITFSDGTTTTVSALIGSSVDDIKTLFESLHSVYFAAYVVDWIAYDIYYGRN